MKVGVIGTGVMGKNHVRVYSELRNVDEVYVFDLNENNMKKCKEYGAIACNSVENLLNSVEAVSICVPTKHHFTIARKAIEKGVHCLIEKPITLTVREGEELLNLLKGKNLVVGVGHTERFNPVVNEIKKIVEKPFYVEIKRHNPTSIRITDASVVEDLMIHDIDIIFNVLFDKNKKYNILAAGSYDVCQATIIMDGSIASLSASRIALKKFRTIYIEDERVTIDGDLMTQEIYIYKNPKLFDRESGGYAQENIIEIVLVNKVEPLKIELKMFIDCIISGKEFPVTPEQAVENLKVCEEIKRYLR